MRQQSRIRRTLFLCCLIAHSEWMAAFNLSLPEDLNKWCPYTKFCDLEPSELITTDNILSKQLILCCEGCSCSAECGLIRKCCNDQFDHYRFDENFNPTCKQLVIKDEGNADMKENFFHIIDKCPDVSERCSDKPAAPWGSYHPVYSMNTLMLYYNTWCARCHNQTDTIAFITTIQRGSQVDSYSQILTDMLYRKANGLDSFVRFVAPGETALHELICYPFIIRDCHPKSKHLDELRKLCQSFDATFHDGLRTYGNVYCYVCSFNNKPLDEILENVQANGLCPSAFGRVYEARSNSPFTFLLNPKLTAMVTTGGTVREENEAVWCEGDQSLAKNNCRRIFCPEGQVRIHGECTFLIDEFFVQSMSIPIVLTPETKIPVDMLIEVKSGGATALPNRALLKPYWFSKWDLQLLYKVNEPGDCVEYFVANFFSQFVRSIIPLTVFYNVDKALREPWNIVVRNTSHALTAELDTNLKYVEYARDSKYIPLWLDYHRRSNGNVAVEDNQVLNQLQHVRVQPQLGNLVITRMFYCEQVELLPHEYSLEGRNLYLERKGAYMGHGSFVQVQDGNLTRYRVCLSDLRDGRSGCERPETLHVGLMLYSVFLLVFFCGFSLN